MKDGKGGAESVKKKAIIIIKDKIGDKRIKPRITTSCRVPNIE